MKELVEQILAKKYNKAEKTLSESLLKRVVDTIEEKKVNAGKLFFESTQENSLEEDAEKPAKKKVVKAPKKDDDEREYGVDTERELAAGKSKKKQKAYGLREEDEETLEVGDLVEDDEGNVGKIIAENEDSYTVDWNFDNK